MSVAEKYGIDLSYEHKTACPRCRRNGKDRSGNNLHVYGEGSGAYCWACEFTIPSDAHREKMGWDDEQEEEYTVMTREALTQEEKDDIKDYTGSSGKMYRGIRDDTSSFFGVRYEYDPETGKPCAQYYPCTMGETPDGKPNLVGYRVRRFPKDFSGSVGKVGREVDLIGQWRFRNGGKWCVIVGGETKQLNTYQMLRDDKLKRGKQEYGDIAVVCSTLGEPGAWKQVQAQYEFFSKFERVYICMDADEAGREATEKIAEVLPRGKAYIINMRYKDADDYVVDKEGTRVHKEQEFIQDFWAAKQWTPTDIVAADTIYDEIKERARAEKLPFAPFLGKLNKLLAGGINYGYIVNILAGSGAGKTSFINQNSVYWMQELRVKLGVLSLEAEAGEYGENLLSYYVGKKIALIEDKAEKIAFVESEEVAKAARELFFSEDGEQMLYLVDDRGDYSKLQEKVEQLIVMMGVRVIIIDVLSDVFAGMSIEQIDEWMAWEKKIVKQHKAIIINVTHTRKGSSSEKSASQGKAQTEENIIGSGTQYRSAAINLALRRDKTAEDEEERNTTYVDLLKSRATGHTGPVCQLFYESATHTLWDKEAYMSKKGF